MMSFTKNKIINTIKNPLVKAFFIYVFSDGISRIMPFLVLPIIALYLTPEEYGIVTNFMVLTQILLAFVCLNTYTNLTVEYYKLNDYEIPVYIYNLIILNLVLTIIVLVFVFVNRNFILNYFELDFKWQLLAVEWVFFQSVILLYITKLRLDYKSKKYGYFNFVRSFLSAALTIIMVVILNMNWRGRIYALILTVSSLGVISLFNFFKSNSIKIIYNKNYFKNALLFGLPLLPHTLSFWIKGGLDKLFITNSSGGLHENGLYSFAGLISSILMLINVAFFSAYTPRLIKSLTNIDNNIINNSDSLKIKLVKESYIFIALFFIVCIISNFIFISIIELFFKSEYHGAVVFIPYGVAAVFFSSVYSLFSIFLFYLKKTKTISAITISIALIQSILNYFIVNKYGAIGISQVSVVANILLAGFVMFFSTRNYSMPWVDVFLKQIKIRF